MADELSLPSSGRSLKEIARYVIGAAIGAIVLALLLGKRSELASAWHQLGRANLGWIAAAVAAECVSLGTFACLQRRVLQLAGARLRWPPLALLTLANEAIANTVPGEPVVSSAYRYRFYRRYQVSEAGAGWTIFTILVAQAIGMSALLLLGVLIALLGSTGGRYTGVAVTGLVIVAAAAAVLVRRDLILALLGAGARSVRRLAGQRHAGTSGLAGRVERTLARMGEIPLSASAGLSIIALATGVWFADFLCLVCGFGAIGAPVPWDGVLLAYGVAQVVGTLPIVPGGLGIIEGSLAVILISYGAGHQAALDTAIIYRLISFWLAVAVGWISVGVIARRHRSYAMLAAMATPTGPAHLNNHHRNTLRQIFEHPVSHNIEWHSVVSLLGAVGRVEQDHDGKVAVRIGMHTEIFDPPSGKDIDIEMTAALRELLTNAGYGLDEG